MHPLLSLLTLLPALAQAPADTSGPAQGPPPAPSSFWWGDYDADGWIDALVVHPSGEVVLLRNLGDSSFVDVTRPAGLEGLFGVSQVSWQDADGDGLLDLLLAVPAGAGRLFLGGERARFRDVSATCGLPLERGVLHASWRDYDADGLPDLALATHDGEQLFHNLGQGCFEPAPGAVPGAPTPAQSSPGETTEPGDGAAAPSGAGVAGAARVASVGLAAAAPWCFDLIKDQATGGCVMASSKPTLGMLYPLGNELSIDLAGRVGIGTTTPKAQLDVIGGDIRTSGRLMSTALSGAPLSVLSKTRVTNLNADLLDGLHASDFSQLGKSIGTSELEDGAVTGAKLAANSVTADKIPAGAVGSSELATNSVTGAEIATDAVGSLEIAPGAVRSSEIAGNAVGSAHIVAGAVTSSDVADGTLVDADVSASAAIDGDKVVPDFGYQEVRGGAATFHFDWSQYCALIARGYDVSANDTMGYAGVHGTDDFDGIPTADWDYYYIGLAGISTGDYLGTNYGVLGQSDHVAVRGESSADPTTTYGELAKTYPTGTTGVVGRGTWTGVLAIGEESGLLASNAGGSESECELATLSYGVLADGETAAARFGHTDPNWIDTYDGVSAMTAHTSGYAVVGDNLATTGATGYARGVMGESHSTAGYGVYSDGNLGCSGTKSFVNPHPTDPLKEVRFVCLEGNESGTYFRGTTVLSGGRAVIDVPEEFRLVTSKERSLTVQVTPIGAPAMVWVESKDLDLIVVRGNVDVELDYFVNGVRRGFEEITLIEENSSFLPERLDQPFGTQYPDALRRILVENGILNADFTPNVATQALLESQLEGYRTRMEKARELLARQERRAARGEQAESERQPR